MNILPRNLGIDQNLFSFPIGGSVGRYTYTGRDDGWMDGWMDK
jgi:hypothetical protein